MLAWKRLRSLSAEHDDPAAVARQASALAQCSVRRPLTLRNRPASDPTDTVPFTRGIDSPIRRRFGGRLRQLTPRLTEALASDLARRSVAADKLGSFVNVGFLVI